jgi:hypothetical protein
VRTADCVRRGGGRGGGRGGRERGGEGGRGEGGELVRADAFMFARTRAHPHGRECFTSR